MSKVLMPSARPVLTAVLRSCFLFALSLASIMGMGMLFDYSVSLAFPVVSDLPLEHGLWKNAVVIIVAVSLTYMGLRYARIRLQLVDGASMSPLGTGDFVVLCLCFIAAPAAIWISMQGASEVHDGAGLRWRLVPVSLAIVLGAAYAEELTGRYAFLAFWGRSRAVASICLFVQSVIFALGHGRAARLTVETFVWYGLAGLLLGFVFLRFRSLLLNVALHCTFNVSIALTDYFKAWIAGRPIMFVPETWKRWFMMFELVLVALLAWRVFFGGGGSCSARGLARNVSAGSC